MLMCGYNTFSKLCPRLVLVRFHPVQRTQQRRTSFRLIMRMLFCALQAKKSCSNVAILVCVPFPSRKGGKDCHEEMAVQRIDVIGGFRIQVLERNLGICNICMKNGRRYE